MKKLFYTLLLVIASTRLFALSGGPDAFGYTWKDSNEPNGPTFHWVSRPTIERAVVGFADDNVKGPYSINTSGNNLFKFYWLTYDKIWISSNGYISFGDINLSATFPSIPNPNDGKHNFISAMLADLSFYGLGNPGKCYFRNTIDSVIITWKNVPFYATNDLTYTGSNSFQIILDKIDYSITINFLSQSGLTGNSDIKTGIENYTGNIGLQPAHLVGTYPPANYTIKYYYPSNSTYTVKDGSAMWNSNFGNNGLFIPYPSTFEMKANIRNTGNITILSPYTAAGKIKYLTGANQVTTSVNFNTPLYGSQDTTFTYNNTFSPSITGTFSYITKLSGIANDAFPTNDSIVQEIVAIDTSMSSYELNFSDNISEDGLSWQDGAGGIAVYYAPPEYPVKVTSTKFYISSNMNNVKFIAKIFDDDGENGDPGTLLDSVMVQPDMIGGYTTVPTNNYVIIPSGGVYVLWEMAGLSITLGSDLTPPFSLRTYEYVADAWTAYRNNQKQDFLIGLVVEKTPIEDIGISRINTPSNDSVIDAATTVSCWLKNYGQLAKTDFPVSYKLINANTVITENYTATAIYPGDSVLFSFSTQIQSSIDFSGELCVWTSMNFDFDLNNDTACINVIIYNDISEYGHQGTINVYPNPFDDKTIIEFTNTDNSGYDIFIYDLLGRVTKSELGITGNKYTLDKGNLIPGIYTLELRGKNLYRKKIIIK
ncbi:MAG: T9SS type A sorting domain-containing protein [Bacteroidetes bacterium]|nr:T9SS type A sorting domain-containing protein [Bacteroidota bacterium]